MSTEKETNSPVLDRGKNDAILFFTGDWAFLSNFHHSPIEYEGITFPSVEHAFQAAKTLDHNLRPGIAAETTPGRAKRAGRRLELRDDWEFVKFGVMKVLVGLKFTSNPELARKLLSTGDRYLEEGNNWGDRIWGCCNGSGQNCLGHTLMEVRDRIRDLEPVFEQ